MSRDNPFAPLIVVVVALMAARVISLVLGTERDPILLAIVLGMASICFWRSVVRDHPGVLIVSKEDHDRMIETIKEQQR